MRSVTQRYSHDQLHDFWSNYGKDTLIISGSTMVVVRL